MGYLQEAYLGAAIGLVAFLYRSTWKAALQRTRPQRLLLARPVVVLLVAYLSGLNVPVIADSFAFLVPPPIMEPLFYLVTLLALPVLPLFPFLKPTSDDTQKPI